MSNCSLDSSGDLFEIKGVQHIAHYCLWFIFLLDGNISVCTEVVVVTLTEDTKKLGNNKK